ncbi:MAG: DUF4837 family protein, partial [Bacteroidota bacterium]
MQFNTKIFFLLIIGFIVGCSADMQEKLQSVPYAIGPANQLAIICDNDLWKEPTGDTLQHFFSSAYPLLPQPEPIFDVIHFSVNDMNAAPTRRELRSYLITADLSKPESPATQFVLNDLGQETIQKAKEDPNYFSKVGKDKWAQGQLLIYIFGYGEKALQENIIKSFPAVKKKFNEHDLKQIDAKTYLVGENEKLSKKVRKQFGVNLKVPFDYVMAIQDEEGSAMWMRRETAESSSNILIHKYTYENQEQLTREGLINIQNELGKKYVTTNTAGAYMVINDEELPMIFETKTNNGIYTAVGSGIWEMTQEFMGGPFRSYIFNKPDTKELYFINTFVHAPGEKKRKFMQYLDHVISSFRIEE